MRATERFALGLALLIGLASKALGETNAPAEVFQPGGSHDLSPFSKLVPTLLWSFGVVVLVVAAAVALLRYRLNTNLYRATSDQQWQEDAQEEALVPVTEGDVAEACAELGKPAPAHAVQELAAPAAAVPPPERLYTPASGPAWNEAMLNAFLSACWRASCLGRAGHEPLANPRPGVSRRPPTHPPDPREAEFIRILKARWHEFQVDPDHGIFIEHAGAGQVCLVEVQREKHAVVRAALNAGLLVTSLGRYLRSTDLAYPSGPGRYHVPSRSELAALSAEEKQRLVRVKDIREPWQAMLAGIAAQA